MKTKKLLALLLAGCMVFGIAGCGNGSKEKENDKKDSHVSAEVPDYINMDSQLPIVKEGTDVTLEVMIVNGPLYSNLDSIKDVYFTQAYEEKTGVKIEWTEVSSDAFDDQLALRLTKGDLPDVILKGGVSNSSQLKYGEQGYFLNLMENGMLETFAPNYWALSKEYPEILSASMTPDGSVYSLGMVRNSTGSTVASKLFFNQNWLSKVGLSVPTTSDEFYNVLKAFKNNDPNGNGRADEIGLYIKPDHLQYVTFGMFGIGNRGRNNSYIDWDAKSESVRYFPATEEFRDWVEWVSKMYQEGLINKEYFDFTESNLGNYINNDTCGVFAYTNLCMIGEETQQKFTYLDGAMTGPDGAKDYYGVNSIGSTGSFIITTACEYPEVALRWADYFYCDEGSLFFYFGDEGVTYDALDDGTYKYNDTVLADYHSGADSFDGCATRVSLYGYGNTPTMTKVPYNAADDNKGIALEAANALIEDCANAWPEFTFTTQEQRIIEDSKGDLDAYVGSMRDAWIMGTQPLDDNTWSQFLKTIENMGVQDVLEVYEAALERAYENGFKEGYHTLNEFE
ncbi:MAG: extracellular solute-binding protein [Tyzzerella sp.]|nr:extracellular solute-binding protein [Tyzzerella sp.]